jgi:DNA mismatch repair ATPase MutS
MSDALSLLWHTTPPPPTYAYDEYVLADLNLHALIRQLSLAPQYETLTRNILLHLSTDESVIRYRQAILADVLRSARLQTQLESALTAIETLESYLSQPQWRESPLQQVAWRLSELENYVSCVTLLAQILQDAGSDLHSDGFCRLRDHLQAMTQTDLFQQLQAELPSLLEKIRHIASITIGINLDSQMRPTTAMLVSINTQKFAEETLMSRLFGKRQRDTSADSITGVGKLHDSRAVNMGGANIQIELSKRDSPFMPPLFRDLAILLDETSRPMVESLRKYTHISAQFLIALKAEIAFYVGAAKLTQLLIAAGLPLCQPDVAPMADRMMRLSSMYNITLALQLRGRHPQLADVMVKNEVHFDTDGRIFILTGPNQGGKTTYTQGVGLAQVLFQAGLLVPAASACLSPVDGIYTHFATEERPDLESGRLGEEARRLHRIFERATPHSLILLNESLASTSLTEGLHLARDVVRVLRVLGVRAIFATHLHDLALECDTLNITTAGDSVLVSLVSLVEIDRNPEGDVIRRTYRIRRGAPPGKSYAIELAAKYGISYDQLTALLKQRQGR